MLLILPLSPRLSPCHPAHNLNSLSAPSFPVSQEKYATHSTGGQAPHRVNHKPACPHPQYSRLFRPKLQPSVFAHVSYGIGRISLETPSLTVRQVRMLCEDGELGLHISPQPQRGGIRPPRGVTRDRVSKTPNGPSSNTTQLFFWEISKNDIR